MYLSICDMLLLHLVILTQDSSVRAVGWTAEEYNLILDRNNG